MSWAEKIFFYTDHIEVPLPAGHRFPMQKYRMLREELLNQNVMSSTQLFPAPEATEQELNLAHSHDYIQGLVQNTIPEKDLRPIGLTWSPLLLKRSLCSVGGFLKASEEALKTQFSA